MSLFSMLRRPRPDQRAALRPLWDAVVKEARAPEWYRDREVADTVEGRFDMITLILALVMLRMEKDAELIGDTARLTELFVEDMEGHLREQGIGDPALGKHVGRMMSTLGGRIAAYREGIENGGTVLEAAVRRNVTLTCDPCAADVAEGAMTVSSRLASTGSDDLLQGKIA